MTTHEFEAVEAGMPLRMPGAPEPVEVAPTPEAPFRDAMLRRAGDAEEPLFAVAEGNPMEVMRLPAHGAEELPMPVAPREGRGDGVTRGPDPILRDVIPDPCAIPARDPGHPGEAMKRPALAFATPLERGRSPPGACGTLI